MRNASAFGSLAQHSGVFVLMFVFGLMVMPTSQFQTTHVVRSSTTETKKITVQSIPKPKASARNRTGRKFHRQWPMTRAGDILTKLLFVWRENTDATPTPRDSHIPLLRIRCRLDGRIGKKDVIHGFTL